MILVGRASESASRQSDCLGLRHNPLSCSPASKMSGSNTAFWCAISPKRYDSVTGAIEPCLQRWQRATPQFHCRAEVKTAPKGRVTPKILSKLHGLCSVRKRTKHSDQNHLLKQVLVIVLDPDRVLSARCNSGQKVIKHLLKPIFRL